MRVLPQQPVRAILRSTLTAFVLGAVIAAAAPLASADQLDDARSRVGSEIGRLGNQRDHLRGRISAQASAVAEADAANVAAMEALRSAESQLADAQARLAAAESQLSRSRDLDAKRQAQLEAAETALKKAQADVAAAKAAYDSLNRRIDLEVSLVTQQQGPLVNLALLLSDDSASELNHRAQIGDTLFDVSAQQLDEAERRRFALDEAQAKADAAEAAALQARKEAAEQLRASEAAQQEAADAKADVARLVDERDAVAQGAAKALADEQQLQSEMEADAAAVEQRIKERMAKADKLDAEIAERDRIRAEQARKAREAEEARQRQLAAERAEAAKKAAAAKAKASSSSTPAKSNQPSKPSKPSKPSRPSKPAKPSKPSRSSRPSNDGVFMLPVRGRFTSPYGMRVHPVTGVYKLHDGQDIGASCGTPMRAAYGGVVSERYYNRGYGNRLMIDHGRVNGHHVTTGYNHATHYTVRVGQRVSKGQVIGYVGNTGYSTGCHLHLMVWQNGRVVNPMKRWF